MINWKKLDKNDLMCQKMATMTGFDLTEVVLMYDRLEYTSKSGLRLTESHISNFLREDLNIRRMPQHFKPKYKGKNWILCNRKNGKPIKQVTLAS
jgi:hypothetical protein